MLNRRPDVSDVTRVSAPSGFPDDDSGTQMSERGARASTTFRWASDANDFRMNAGEISAYSTGSPVVTTRISGWLAVSALRGNVETSLTKLVLDGSLCASPIRSNLSSASTMSSAQ